MSNSNPPNFNIILGRLGSGKTTLIRHIIDYQHSINPTMKFIILQGVYNPDEFKSKRTSLQTKLIIEPLNDMTIQYYIGENTRYFNYSLIVDDIFNSAVTNKMVALTRLSTNSRHLYRGGMVFLNVQFLSSERLSIPTGITSNANIFLKNSSIGQLKTFYRRYMDNENQRKFIDFIKKKFIENKYATFYYNVIEDKFIEYNFQINPNF
jgi:guanylate kinase